MDETWILQRFLARDEEGLAAAYAQLGPGLTALAARIAGPETAEECVNDALLAAWQTIPPLAPVHLAAYLAKLTRNAALNRYRAQNAQKRGGSIVAVSPSWPSACRAAKARPTVRRRRSCAARSPPFCARSRSVSGRSFWRGIFTPCR